jgi:hypothetical protein
MSPGTAEPEICFGDFKPVIGSPQRLDSFPCRFAKRRPVEQEAIGRPVAAADTASQLVELGQTKPFGALNDHDGRLRDVHTPTSMTVVATSTRVAPVRKSSRAAVFFRGLQAAVDEADRDSSAALDSMAWRPTAVESSSSTSTFGQTQKTRSPRADGAPDGVDDFFHARVSGMARVSTGFRPAGFSSRMDTSRSPLTACASVRGMGVALMTSMWGLVGLAGELHPVGHAEAVLLIDDDQIRDSGIERPPGKGRACRQRSGSSHRQAPSSVASRTDPLSRPDSAATV